MSESQTKAATKDTLFKTPKSKSESKADATNDAARAMIQAEADRRDAKTARLREARLKMEAEKPVETAPAKRGTRKTPVRSRKS